jgi:hypothetical protein
MLNVARSWATADAKGRSDDTVGIDGGCQSEEEYGSGEGLGEHLDNKWMKERKMAARSARDGQCGTRLGMGEVVINIGKAHGRAFIHERERHSDNVVRPSRTKKYSAT